MQINAFIGNQVRTLREAKPMKQAALARAMGISPAHLCQLEAGKKMWVSTNMELAAAGLGCDVRLLLPPRRTHVEQAAGA